MAFLGDPGVTPMPDSFKWLTKHVYEARIEQRFVFETMTHEYRVRGHMMTDEPLSLGWHPTVLGAIEEAEVQAWAWMIRKETGSGSSGIKREVPPCLKYKMGDHAVLHSDGTVTPVT